MLELADSHARPVGLDDERGQAAVLTVGHREDDVEVGNPRFVIQFLVPLMTHSSPSSTAWVCIPAGSEPGFGLGEREGRRPLTGRAARQEAAP